MIMDKPIEEKSIEEKSKSICNTIIANLGNFIKETRKNKGYSLRDLSKISGVSTTVISDIENLVYLPKFDVIVRLGLALEISIDELFSNMQPDQEIVDIATTNIDPMRVITNSVSYLGLNANEIDELMNYLTFMMYKKENSSYKTSGWKFFS